MKRLVIACLLLVSALHARSPRKEYPFGKISLKDAVKTIEEGTEKEQRNYADAIHAVLISDLKEAQKLKYLDKIFFDEKRHRAFAAHALLDFYHDTLLDCAKRLKNPNAFFLRITQQAFYKDYVAKKKGAKEFPMYKFLDALGAMESVDEKLQDEVLKVPPSLLWRWWVVPLVAKHFDHQRQLKYLAAAGWDWNGGQWSTYERILFKLGRFRTSPRVYNFLLNISLPPYNDASVLPFVRNEKKVRNHLHETTRTFPDVLDAKPKDAEQFVVVLTRALSRKDKADALGSKRLEGILAKMKEKAKAYKANKKD